MSELVKKITKKLPPGEFRIQIRIWTQWAFFALAAGPLFVLAPIIKQIPAPWYVCWSCPTASAACPLGNMQHFTSSGEIAFYTIGFLALIGILVGRMTCGWTCPMGFIQEMLYKAKRYGSIIVGIIIFGTTMFLAWFTPFMGMLRADSGESYGLGYLLKTGQMNAFTGWLIGYLAIAIFLSIWFFIPTKKFHFSNDFANYTRWFFFIIPFIVLPIITRIVPFESASNAYWSWLSISLVSIFGILLIVSVFLFFLKKNKVPGWVKVILFIAPFVVLPILLRTSTTGAEVKFLEGQVWWCKICPVGTITAGFPQMYLQLLPQSAFPLFGLTSTAFIGVSTYQGIFGEARVMYFIKWVMTSGLLFCMVNSVRFFCKGVCPLGTFFTIFNWFSSDKIKVDQANCRGSSCNWCLKHCPMDVAIYDPTAQWHCIRCLDCLGCPFNVVTHEVTPVFAWATKKPDKKVIPLKTPNPPNNPDFFQWAGFVKYTPPQARN